MTDDRQDHSNIPMPSKIRDLATREMIDRSLQAIRSSRQLLDRTNELVPEQNGLARDASARQERED